MTTLKYNKEERGDNMLIDNVEVTVEGLTDVSEKEMRHYVEYVGNQTDKPLTTLLITDAGDGNVTLHYELSAEKFERIRRITGYLVGSIDRWNNAKRAEEHERVKHA